MSKRLNTKFYAALFALILAACGLGDAISSRSGGSSEKNSEDHNNTTTPGIDPAIDTPAVVPDNLPAIPLISPRRTYVMQAVDSENVNNATLTKAEGIVIRTRWATIEPTPGTFNLSWVTTQLQRAKSLNKYVQLEVLAGDDAPQWLEAEGAAVMKYSDGQVPLPWDEVFQARYKRMIDHLAKTLDWSKVTHMHCIGADNAEWHYSQFDDGAFYSVSGYSDAKMVEAHVKAVTTMVAALPNVAIVCDIGDHNKAWTAQAIAALKAKFAGHVGFQMDALKATTPLTYEGYTRIRDAAEQGHHAGFEMIGPSVGAGGTPVARFGGPFADAISIANGTKVQWLIVYQADL